LVQQVRVVPEAIYRFKHALTEEVAYDSLLEHQRNALHDAVGRAIESRYAGQLEEQVERLVHHFSRAESWAKAIRYGMMSADRASALSQFADAMATLERVQEWLTFLPDEAARHDLETDMLLRLERNCESLGLRMRQMGIVATLVSRLSPGGATAQLAQAYLRQGDAYTLLRRYPEAEAALDSSVRVATALGLEASVRNALRSLALLRSHEARHEEALETIERVITLGREAGDTRAEAGDLATMANILRALGRHELALQVISEAIEHGRVGAQSLRYGALLNVMATVYRDLGHYDKALDYYRQTAQLMNNSVYASFSLPGIAYVQLQQGQVEEALATYREAVELNKKVRYADGAAHACRSLGEVLVGLKREAEAIPYLRDAAALFRQLEDHENEALMWRRLAMTHETLRQFDDATTAWNQVLAYARAGAPLNEAEAIDGLSRAQLGRHNAAGIQCWQRGAFDEALSHFEAGLRLCEERSDRVHEGLLRNSVGATLLRLQQPERAIPMLQRSVQVTSESGEQTLQGHALLTLTRAYMATGEREAAQATLAEARELVGHLQDAAIAGAVERLQQEMTMPSSPATAPVL
jgi:tetratricopeptide (TPR) repeat protein